MKFYEIPVSSICFSKESIRRSSQEQSVIESYTCAIKNGSPLPPLIVFKEGDTYWLADGYLRLRAIQSLGYVKVLAEIYEGGQRDAILYSLSANASHGLTRTDADKYCVILKLLHDPEWSHMSDQEIARHCAVSDRLVREIRATL